jgi:hypothetical protein
MTEHIKITWDQSYNSGYTDVYFRAMLWVSFIHDSCTTKQQKIELPTTCPFSLSFSLYLPTALFLLCVCLSVISSVIGLRLC